MKPATGYIIKPVTSELFLFVPIPIDHHDIQQYIRCGSGHCHESKI